MKKEEDWLETAKEDLESAEILYEKNHYPQSVFCLQQSVEKANKYFLLKSTQYSTEEDLKSNFGHDTYKIINKWIKKFQVPIFKNDELIPVLDKLFNCIEKISLEKTNSKELAHIKETWTNFIGTFESTSTNKIEQKVDNLKTELENENVLNKAINDLEDLPKSLAEIEQLSDNDFQLPIDIMNICFSEIFAIEILDENKKNLLRLLGTFKNIILELLKVQIMLILLSLITSPSEQKSRYGDDEKSPHDIYKCDNAIIKQMPKLFELQHKLLDSINNIGNLLSNLKDVQ